MKIWLIAILAGVVIQCGYVYAKTNSVLPKSIEPISLYGEEIFFDVYREDSKAGFHWVKFIKMGERLGVESNFQLKIDFLFFTAFQYDYQSTATWANGQLHRLNATIDDDGELFSVLAVRKSDLFQLNVPDGVVSVDAPLYPTNHWNPAVVEQVRVLNTLTGKINNVQIKAQNKESVLTENGTIEATRYAYSGDLETEVWYDDAGRWVKMRFKARDGSTINYVCRRCQGPSDPQAPK
ncbi:MAG: DUF6134 family protein [Rhodospirillales bacterium]